MFEKFKEKIEKSRERIFGPRVVRFENGVNLVSEIDSEHQKIFFEKDGKQLLDLTSVAPEGTMLEFNLKNRWGARFSIDKEGQERIHIFTGKFNGAESILCFLHEVGHLHDRVNSDAAVKKQQKRLVLSREDEKAGNQFSKERLAALKEDREAYTKSELNAWQQSDSLETLNGKMK